MIYIVVLREWEICLEFIRSCFLDKISSQLEDRFCLLKLADLYQEHNNEHAVWDINEKTSLFFSLTWEILCSKGRVELASKIWWEVPALYGAHFMFQRLARQKLSDIANERKLILDWKCSSCACSELSSMGDISISILSIVSLTYKKKISHIVSSARSFISQINYYSIFTDLSSCCGHFIRLS